MGKLNKRNNKFTSKNNKVLNFDVQISDLKILNPNLSMAVCKILYIGKNRNGSFITQKCADDMVKQLAYTAVIGEWKSNIDNFGGHGGKIEIENNDITYVDTTIAYGCCMDNDSWYEDITEKDGAIHKYLCCNLVLFTGKYPELQVLISNGSFESMEIEVVESEEKDGLLYINKAIFSGLCILGRDDENPENSTIPCFESSTIEVSKQEIFSLLKEGMKDNFALMLKEIKTSLNPKLEDIASSGFDLNNKENRKDKNKKEDETNMSKEVIKTEEMAKTKVEPKKIDDKVEDKSKEKIDTKTKDDPKKVKESKEEDTVKCETDEKATEVECVVDGKEVIDKKVEDKKEAKKEEKPVKDDKKYELEIADLKEKISNKDSEIETLKADYEIKLADMTEKFNTVNTEVETLKAFKLQKETEEKEAKFAEYAEELTEEEVKDVRDKIKEFSLEEVETKLQLLFAKKNHKPTKNSLPKYNNMGLDKVNFSKKEDKAEPEINTWDKLENIKNK